MKVELGDLLSDIQGRLLDIQATQTSLIEELSILLIDDKTKRKEFIDNINERSASLHSQLLQQFQDNN